MGRIVGMDFGTVRIGLALSDERKILASPLPFFSAEKSLEKTCEKLYAYLLPHSIETIVIGLPLHLNGSESRMAEEVRLFVELLREKFGVPIIFWDERLTSAEIERLLKSASMSRKKRVGVSDSLAATLILQGYLDARLS